MQRRVGPAKEDWQNSGAFIDEVEGKLIQAHGLVLSMPEGTDERGVKRAVRGFAALQPGDHSYAMARHTFENDPDFEPFKHPHVHLIVKMRGENGKRLNPSKEYGQRWRETDAEALGNNGIDGVVEANERAHASSE